MTYRVALVCLSIVMPGDPALAQDAIASILINAERPLINQEAAKRIARIVLETYYGREGFIPSHRFVIEEETTAWKVTFENRNTASDLYKLGFRTATLRISKTDGAVLSISR